MLAQKPPVILALNCHSGHKGLGQIGNSNEFTEQIFGVRPLYLTVDWESFTPWWANPLAAEALHHILFDLQPNFSKIRAEKWVHETGFVKRVRHDDILIRLSQALELDGIEDFFDPDWCKAVRIVVLEAELFKVSTKYFVQRVFLGQDFMDPLFPNAAHYSGNRCMSGFDEVWVKELADAKAAADKAKRDERALTRGVLASASGVTQDQVLSGPIWQLDLQTRYRNRLAACGYTTVGALVEASEVELLSHIGISHATVRAVRKALAKVGLSLKGEVPEA